jgi:outer membrane protein
MKTVPTPALRRLFAAGLASLLAMLAVPCVRASTEPLIDFLAVPGSAAVGVLFRTERSPYEGGGARNDLVPVYVYEGERAYLHATRAGLKLLDKGGAHRLDLIADYRFEGLPYDDVPASLAGLHNRSSGIDVGLAYRYRTAWGDLNAEYLQDPGGGDRGSELRVGYSYDWHSGRLHLRPAVRLSARSARLNDYYYGVSPDEATAVRPAYQPGSSVHAWVGVYGYYDLGERWKVIGAYGVSSVSRTVRDSPIVRDRAAQPSAFVGVAYDFGSHRAPQPDGNPLHVKLLYGKSTDCNLLPAVTLRCSSVGTQDNTRVAGVELGKTFMERVHGWPLDFVGYVGLLRHDENNLQQDVWQLNLYMKAYYYGFPWSARVKTRVGLGMGLSVTDHVLAVEQRDQARRGRQTSKLLNYLDPTVDVSVGDLLGVRSLRRTFVGVGVSHRSGILGTSQLLGNVDGGSNYFYSYVESSF